MSPVVPVDFKNPCLHRIKSHKLYYGVIRLKGKFYFKFSIVIRNISIDQNLLLAVVDSHGCKANRSRRSAIQYGSLYSPCLGGLRHDIIPTHQKDQEYAKELGEKVRARKIV